MGVLIRMIYKAIKISIIFIRHGMNPFAKVGENKEKMRERFSESEKKWIIDTADNDWAKEYLQKLIVGD